MKQKANIPVQQEPGLMNSSQATGLASPSQDIHFTIQEKENNQGLSALSPVSQLHADTNAKGPKNSVQQKSQTAPASGINFTIQKKENKTGLPDQLKSGIENLSGHAMDDVKVHYNSSQPAQLNAHAYAQGNQIHVAPGQEKHLAHEAWHVVQQKQGRVKPTKQLKSSVAINDDAGLEKEADVMGAKALHHVIQQPTQLKETSIHSTMPAQRTMAELHARNAERSAIAGYTEEKYTTVGFEIDLLRTSDGSPLEGISHLVVGKSGTSYPLLGMKYILETDAGNVLELVTPPYMIQRGENGVLNAADLVTTMKDLKSGFDATLAAVGADPNNATQAIAAINAGFNTNLTYIPVNRISDEHPEGEDGVIDESHMSTRMNWNRLRIFEAKEDDTQATDLRITRGPEFSPQINIFTTIDGYHGLKNATQSRLDGGAQFHAQEAAPITAAKTAFIARLRARVPDARYTPSIDHLNNILLNIEPRRIALIRQKEAQRTAYQEESLIHVNRDRFNRDSGDASFVKDIDGVWLKTDIINYIIKALGKNGDYLKELGGAIMAANTAYRGPITGAYDATAAGWGKRVLRLGRTLYREGEHASGNISQSHREELTTLRAENNASWSTRTFSLSDRILGMRHDTLLTEALATRGDELLRAKNDALETDRDPGSWNMKEKVLIEVRNMTVAGYNEAAVRTAYLLTNPHATAIQINAHLLEAKVNAFVEAWEAQM